MKHFLVGAMTRIAIIAMLCSLSWSAYALANNTATHSINIPPQNLATALQELSKQSRTNLIYRPEQVRGFRTLGLVGTFSAEQAATNLIKGTPLKVSVDTTGALLIAAPLPSGAPVQGSPAADAGKEGKTPSSAGFRMAQVGQEAPAGSSTVKPAKQHSQGEGTASQLQEVIVTAEKRRESLLDVPMSLTALNGVQLERSHSYRFEDYVAKVPGLELIDFGGWGSQLVIRGLTTGGGNVNTSVATYIDETPYGTEGAFAESALTAPNLDAFDMQRIEVLKGPQGTLYGANALGGVLKYVTNPPDPSALRASVKSGMSSVDHGATGFDVHAMVNIPLGDHTALRVVGYDNAYPGFINDPLRGQTDINGSHYIGGRASLLYQPSAVFSLRLNVLYQKRSFNDWPDEDVRPNSLTPIYCNLCQERLLSQAGYYTNQLDNVTMHWNLGVADLMSSTSYGTFNLNTPYDGTNTLGSVVSAIFKENLGVYETGHRYGHTWTQEVRLSSTGESALQWLGGVYFTDEYVGDFGLFLPIDVASRTLLPYLPYNMLEANYTPITYREVAGYANIDYHLAPTFDVALGGRWSTNRQSVRQQYSGLFSGGAADFVSTSSDKVGTYSVDVRWHVTHEAMLYARVASRYAPGGPNDVAPIFGNSFPPNYKASTTKNYETGVKSSLFSGRITAELSAFDVEWRDIQLLASVKGVSVLTNGGGARSEGMEWNFGYVVMRGLTLGINGAYTDAYLTAPTPASVGGKSGNRLPAVPLWESSASADYERPFSAAYSGYVGVNWRFSGKRYANFQPASARQQMPKFSILVVRAGVETNTWSLTLYVNNVGNKEAINYLINETLAGGNGAQSAVLYEPRTFGLTAAVNF